MRAKRIRIRQFFFYFYCECTSPLCFLLNWICIAFELWSGCVLSNIMLSSTLPHSVAKVLQRLKHFRFVVGYFHLKFKCSPIVNMTWNRSSWAVTFHTLLYCWKSKWKLCGNWTADEKVNKKSNAMNAVHYRLYSIQLCAARGFYFVFL